MKLKKTSYTNRVYNPINVETNAPKQVNRVKQKGKKKNDDNFIHE